MRVAPFWDYGDTPNQRNLFLAVLNLEISLVTDAGTPSHWKRGILSVNIFQSLSKAFMGDRRPGGWGANRWLKSFDLEERRVGFNPFMAKRFFLEIKGSVDF